MEDRKTSKKAPPLAIRRRKKNISRQGQLLPARKTKAEFRRRRVNRTERYLSRISISGSPRGREVAIFYSSSRFWIPLLLSPFSYSYGRRTSVGRRRRDMVAANELELEGKGVPAIELRLRLPDVNASIRGLIGRREAGEFLSGALAGAMAKAVLAPLETIRTRMVVGVGSKNIGRNFLEIMEDQGWRGLWAGNNINMIRIVPTQAIELATFEWVKRTVSAAKENSTQNGSPKLQIGPLNVDVSLSWVSPVAVGGAAAGIMSTLICHPLEVIKDRLTVDRETYPTIGLAFRRIYKDQGIGGLYSGMSPTLVGMLPYSTCYYFMYETIKKSYCLSKDKKTLSRAELLVVGALSGLTASTISFPLEVARKRLMVGSLKGQCPPNMVAALREVVREEGLKGLYRGWGASCLKVMPNSGITWMFYELWKDILLVDRSYI